MGEKERHGEDLEIGEIRFPGNNAKVLTPEEAQALLEDEEPGAEAGEEE